MSNIVMVIIESLFLLFTLTKEIFNYPSVIKYIITVILLIFFALDLSGASVNEVHTIFEQPEVVTSDNPDILGSFISKE